MRIRKFRIEDIPALYHVYQEAIRVDQVDHNELLSEDDFTAWLMAPDVDAPSNAFVITDDDDELMTWGQAGTLEGIEGEIVGYTLVQLQHDADGYHFRFLGAVAPQHRHRNAGRVLFVGALNRARLLAAEFEFEAEREGVPIYFEALLPGQDPASARLAAKFEMVAISMAEATEMQLYRGEL